ncbi:MAG TPA: sensor histidine kinase [Nocardioides sp.]|uniref:sensor histidine kinase n=1 Tax=Nocardioides sp. TaxID=35761 RepID=UPI002D7F3572|nr:sensor histidine kinase [Nocardioides sp.]HET6653162.1 sensor histidine kinase [Nocardioides sp.]
MRRVVAVAAPAALGRAGAATAVVLADRADSGVGDAVAILLVVTAYVVGAGVVLLARPGDRVAALMLAGGTSWGLGEGLIALGVHGHVVAPGSVAGADWLAVLGTALRGLGWIVLVVAVPLYFPDGRLARPDRRWPQWVLLTALGCFGAATLLTPEPLETRLQGMENPMGLPAPAAPVTDTLALTGLALVGVLLVVAVAGLVHRWSKADDFERRRLRWFAVAVACPLLILPLVATPWAEPWMFALVTMPAPVVLAVTLLMRRIRDGEERLVLAREEERRLLRRDLHDGLGPALAALTLRVDTLRNRAGDPDLDLEAELLALRSGIQDTVTDVRRIVTGLRPPALDELGVAGAIEQLAAGLAGPGLRVDVRVPDLPPVPAAVEVALYRVVQEAVTNVVKHAAATRARIAVAVCGDEVRLDVTDNGAGGARPRDGGVGLAGMRDRVEEIGGTLRLSSRPGTGTTVAVILPLAVAR